MINLEPIAESVQKRMFEKMRALGRETSYSDSPTDVLTQQEMMSRTTFIKMVSNQKDPVILMGGELKEDGGLRAGYDEIYGSRGNVENPNKRPMPGIKSIDVSFKGGARAQREATINWTCWSFEDITRLTPHFLAHGKEVLLEWGWVYNTKSLINLPTFLELDGKTKRSVYTDYISEILSGDGDFDMMVGQVKNFEYTTRADGGFDCQTILGSIGVSIIDNTIPTDNKQDGGDVTEANLSKRAARNLTDEQIVTYDTSVSLKTFIKTAVLYFGQKCQKDKHWNNKELVDSGRGKRALFVEPNKWIVDSTPVYNELVSEKNIGTSNSSVRVWIRWGWFEDNILSKFTSLVAGKDIISQFRSIDVDIKTNQQTSVRIRNSKYLETVNFEKYILPGQFLPEKKERTIEIGKNKDKIILGKDTDYTIKLADLVNENFPSFSVDAPGFKESNEAVVVPKGTKLGPNGEKVIVNSKGVSYYKPRIQKNNNSEFGYLRNMLINLETIQTAFGVIENSVEQISIKEAMESLFLELNKPIDFWSFQVEQDAIRSERARIIDNQITAIDFNKPIPSQASSYDGVDVRNLGIFYFPVWRHDSIVKSQNVVTKVNNQMALAVMYGSNLDQLKYPNSDFGVTGEKEGLVIGGLNNENKDNRTKDLDFAFKQSLNIGTPNGFANEQLKVNDSTDDVMEFLKTKVDDIKDYYEEKEEQNKELGASASTPTSDNEAGFDQSKPKPMLRFMTSEQKQKFFEQATLGDEQDIKEFYGAKYKTIGREKYNTGELKKVYVKAIEYLTTTNTENKIGGGDNNKSILVPLEMELVVDGTGGMYPGNSFHSSYLPQNYKDKTVFQMFDVNHTVDSSGWSTTISGKMRSTINQVFTEIADNPDRLQDLIDNYVKKRKGEEEVNIDTSKPSEEETLLYTKPTEGTPDYLPNYLKKGVKLTTTATDNTSINQGYKIRTNEMQLRGGAGGTVQKWGYIIEVDEKGNVENK